MGGVNVATYEYLVIDYTCDKVLGIFDDINNALLFIKALYETYYNDDNLKITIVRQERTV